MSFTLGEQRRRKRNSRTRLASTELPMDREFGYPSYLRDETPYLDRMKVLPAIVSHNMKVIVVREVKLVGWHASFPAGLVGRIASMSDSLWRDIAEDEVVVSFSARGARRLKRAWLRVEP